MLTPPPNQSVLCVPVRNEEGNVVAVAQMINKKSDAGSDGVTNFTQADRDLVSAFASFCSQGLAPTATLAPVSFDRSLDAFSRKYSVTAAERGELLSYNFAPWEYTVWRGRISSLFFFGWEPSRCGWVQGCMRLPSVDFEGAMIS